MNKLLTRAPSQPSLTPLPIHTHCHTLTTTTTHNHATTTTGEILYRGKGPFSNSVSKSFPEHDVSAMTLQVPRFRIVRAADGEVHAEFLIVISINSHSPFTFGLWRRHSDFNKLSMKVQSLDLKSGRTNSYKNALLSWQCLIHRKRWFRCLDKVCTVHGAGLVRR